MNGSRAEVQRLASQGYTPRQIALKLGISTQAVYKHLAQLRAEAERKEAAS